MVKIFRSELYSKLVVSTNIFELFPRTNTSHPLSNLRQSVDPFSSHVVRYKHLSICICIDLYWYNSENPVKHFFTYYARNNYAPLCPLSKSKKKISSNYFCKLLISSWYICTSSIDHDSWGNHQNIVHFFNSVKENSGVTP